MRVNWGVAKIIGCGVLLFLSGFIFHANVQPYIVPNHYQPTDHNIVMALLTAALWIGIILKEKVR